MGTAHREDSIGMCDVQPNEIVLPRNTGYRQSRPTLCIGLDFAWFGGSANDRTSQFDFLAAVLINANEERPDLHCRRVALPDRDPNGEYLVAAIEAILGEFKSERIVLAIDAPLQTNRNNLPPRQPRPQRGTVQRRAVDSYLSDCRKRIDRHACGPSGWHPNIQPGAPLPQRLQSVLQQVTNPHRFIPWMDDLSQEPRIVIECFPAEAIWAAKRLNQFPEHLSAVNVRSYKKQAGSQLSACQVRRLVKTALLEGFKRPSGANGIWPRLVEKVIDWMLVDPSWQRNGFYRGGKMLDDVVDSMICLATAISYATNNAHVWFDPDDPGDGHIIGPGRFGEVLQ